MLDQVQGRLSDERRAFNRGELTLYRGLEQVGQSDILEEQVLQILWWLLQEEIYIQHLFDRNICTIDRLRNIANLNYI